MGRRQTTCLLAVVASTAIWLLAMLMVATYCSKTAQFPYPQPVAWSLLFSSMSNVHVSDILAGADHPFDTLIGLSLLVSATVGTFLWHRRFTWIYFLVQGAILIGILSGWMGVLAIMFHILEGGGFDGEWLAEHWPKIEAVGLWGLVSVGISGANKRQRRPNQAL